MRLALTCVLTLCATATLAQNAPVLVTDPQMCAMIERGEDVQETGMVLTATDMSEIEYYCEFDPPVEFRWDGDETATRVGYCSEPGLISPIVVSFQFGVYEPGMVYLWWQDGDQPTVFRACP